LLKQIDLYKELREVHKELVIREEAQKEFIAVAAHELRNPIQPIRGLSQILHSKENLDMIELAKDERNKRLIGGIYNEIQKHYNDFIRFGKQIFILFTSLFFLKTLALY